MEVKIRKITDIPTILGSRNEIIRELQPLVHKLLGDGDNQEVLQIKASNESEFNSIINKVNYLVRAVHKRIGKKPLSYKSSKGDLLIFVFKKQAVGYDNFNLR